MPTEQAIRASGLGFTILRQALYADILVGDLQATLATGMLRRPGGKSRCAHVARADLGVSAAQILMRNEPSGRVYPETMERTYSGEEVAAEISSVFGGPSATRPGNRLLSDIRIPPVCRHFAPHEDSKDHAGIPAQLVQGLVDAGIDEHVARPRLGADQAIAETGGRGVYQLP